METSGPMETRHSQVTKLGTCSRVESYDPGCCVFQTLITVRRIKLESRHGLGNNIRQAGKNMLKKVGIHNYELNPL